MHPCDNGPVDTSGGVDQGCEMGQMGHGWSIEQITDRGALVSSQISRATVAYHVTVVFL